MIDHDHNQKVETDILFIPLLIALLILSVGWVSLFANFFTVNGAPGNPTLQFGSWENYQDREYSQGIAYIEVYGNSTGSFKLHENLTYWENGCQVNGSSGVQLIIGYAANHSLIWWDYADNSTGSNFLKFNVTVTYQNGTVLFSQQNGTYASERDIGGDLFIFEHTMVLNFLTEYSTVYDVNIHYEDTMVFEYGYRNDMGNDTWVDWSQYCSYSSTGSLFEVVDNENGHDWVALKDSSLAINLQTYPYIHIKTLGGYDPDFVSWGIRVHWSNTTSYLVWDHNTTLTGNARINVRELCGTDSTLETIEIIGWDNDLNGETIGFDYLQIYRGNPVHVWSDQQVEFVLSGGIFSGYIMAGVSFIGLCMIPLGSFVGAVMIKNKKLNDENWLLPLMIILLGFALFIGGLT